MPSPPCKSRAAVGVTVLALLPLRPATSGASKLSPAVLSTPLTRDAIRGEYCAGTATAVAQPERCVPALYSVHACGVASSLAPGRGRKLPSMQLPAASAPLAAPRRRAALASNPTRWVVPRTYPAALSRQAARDRPGMPPHAAAVETDSSENLNAAARVVTGPASHNGVRYATRGLSGAPPRWNIKRYVPLALLPVSRSGPLRGPHRAIPSPVRAACGERVGTPPHNPAARPGPAPPRAGSDALDDA